MACVTTTSRLQAGLDMINNIDSQKFPLVLNRIAQCLQNKTDDCKPFTEEDEDRLSTALSVGHSELRLMLDCSTLILKQAAFSITKPSMLQQQLSQQYGLNDDKVQAFVSVWTNQAKNIVAAIKHKSFHPKQVEGVSWLLNASVSSSDTGPMLEPRAVIELKLQNTGCSADKLRLDLDQPQLQTLYDTLEKIQTQLDNLR